MRVGIWPFYSQQNKATGEFQLATCGATKQMLFIADKLKAEGHKVNVAVPEGVSHPFGLQGIPVRVPAANPVQRLHWDTEAIWEVFAGCDVALLNHELLSIPLRAIHPEKRIIQMCAVKPEPLGLFREAWRNADVVVAQTETAAATFRAFTATSVVVWPMAYDAANIQKGVAVRDIDVLFVQRCSANNYTRHEEFLRHMDPAWNTVFVDVTGFLRKRRPDLKYIDSKDYFATLARSRVAVAFNDDGFGGQAIREAIVSGCIPVCLDAPCYRELCGAYWPYHVSHNFSDMRLMVSRALRENADLYRPRYNAAGQSYEFAWHTVRETIYGR